MNQTLLKDLPEFKERIEGNYTLKASIKDELENIEVDTSFESATFENEITDMVVEALSEAEFEVNLDGKIKISNKQDIAIEAYRSIKKVFNAWNFDASNSNDIADSICERITEFVNDNYEWKGIKK
jgi:hypothetical protein